MCERLVHRPRCRLRQRCCGHGAAPAPTSLTRQVQAEDRPDRPAGPGPQSAQAGGSRSTLRASSLPGSISSRLLGTSASEDDFSRQCRCGLIWQRRLVCKALPVWPSAGLVCVCCSLHVFVRECIGQDGWKLHT